MHDCERMVDPADLPLVAFLIIAIAIPGPGQTDCRGSHKLAQADSHGRLVMVLTGLTILSKDRCNELTEGIEAPPGYLAHNAAWSNSTVKDGEQI